MKKLLRFFLFFSYLVFLAYFIILFYVGKNVYLDNKKKSDAILVLGAKAYKGSDYNPCLFARVEHAVDLYKQGFGKKIIMSGGNDIEDMVNEAKIMKKMAEELKVPSTAIILETKSSSSYENIFLSS